MNRIRVALFRDRAAAEPVLDHLRQSGIPAEIHDESRLARLWFVSRRSAGVRVEVPAPLSDKAEQLIVAWVSARDAPGCAIRCTACGSLHVDYPQFTQKSLLTNLAIGLFAGLGLVEKDYYCEDCHYMWPKPSSAPRHVRRHLAPNYFIEDLPDPEPQVNVTIETATGRVQNCQAATEPRGRNDSKAPGPTPVHLPKAFGKLLDLAVPLSAVMLLFGSGASLAASRTPGLASDPSGKTEVSRPEAGERPAHLESPTYYRDVLPILMGKCARCHTDQSVLQNWLDYKTASDDRWEIKRRVWHSWKGSYFKQPMPTGNSPESEAMTEEERRIIKAWVENGAPRGVPETYSGSQSKAQRIEHGKRVFDTICAACHQPTGQGIPGRFPPLAGSDFLNSDKHRAIQIVVNGLQGEITVKAQKFNNSMPQFPLGDEDIASALTFVYNSFGNSGKEVTPEEVAAVRKEGPIAIGKNQTAKVPEEKSPYE